MLGSDHDVDAPAATHLLHEHHTDADAGWRETHGTCCFCGAEGLGVPAEQAVSAEYFTDSDLEQAATGHVCAACAYCMDTRELKQGHWIAHAEGLLTPSTNDLLAEFRKLAVGAYPTPLAVHVTSSPIRSSHAYLWTPVNYTGRPITIAYDRQRVRIADWDGFESLIRVVEDLRLAGFTFDEIRWGEPRIRNVRQIGSEAYRRRDDLLAPHRRTARLELALTLSRSAEDQPRSDHDATHDPLTT